MWKLVQHTGIVSFQGDSIPLSIDEETGAAAVERWQGDRLGFCPNDYTT